MKMYKVLFKNRKAISSEEVDFTNKVNVEIDRSTGTNILKSITIFAESEDESIIIANGIANYCREKDNNRT